MKALFRKKFGVTLVSGILAITLAIPVSLAIMPPKQAEAQAGSECALIFATVFSLILGQHAASIPFIPVNNPSATDADASAGAQSKMDYIKNCIEKKLVYAMVRRRLDQMTNDIVSWINGGFEGKPAFAQNPKRFLTDVADQTLGEFILGSDLAFLCSPFQVQVRLALALNYSTSYTERARCTLSEIFDNVDSAFDDLSGGWDGWFSITQNAENNPFGSYLQGRTQAEARASGAQNLELFQLDWGGGFLSYKKCTHETYVRGEDGEVLLDDNMEPMTTTTPYTGYGGSAKVTVLGETSTYSDQMSPQDDCETYTPGTIIQSQLGATLQQPLNELGVAQDIDKIVNALFNKVVSNVFGEIGLFGMGSNRNDRGSILGQYLTASEQNEGNVRSDTTGQINNSGNITPNGGGQQTNNPQPAQNVAIRGRVSQLPASQSSNREALVDGSRSNSAGGDYSGAVAGPAAATQIYMQVDFDQDKSYLLDKIVVYPGPSTSNQLISFRVQIMNGTTVVWQETGSHTHNNGNPFTVTVPANITGTGVRLQGVSGNGYLQIAEIEAYTRAVPTITLNGSPNMTIAVNTPFTDPGATAVDADGAALLVIASGSVTTSAPGVYTITYTATDSKGAVATLRRGVTVQQGYDQVNR